MVLLCVLYVQNAENSMLVSDLTALRSQ